MSRTSKKTINEFKKHRETDKYKSFVKKVKEKLNKQKDENNIETKNHALADSNEDVKRLYEKSSDSPQKNNNSEKTISTTPIVQDTTTSVIKSPDIIVAPTSARDQVINNNTKDVNTTPIDQIVTENQATTVTKSSSFNLQAGSNSAEIVTVPLVIQNLNDNTDAHDLSMNANIHTTDNNYDLSVIGLL